MEMEENKEEVFRVSGLIAAYLAGTLSAEEEEELERWRAENEVNRERFERCCSVERLHAKIGTYREEETRQAFGCFLKERKRFFRRKWLRRLSACALVAFCLGGGWFLSRQLLYPSRPAVCSAVQRTGGGRGMFRPVLTLANGERMELPDGPLECVKTEQGTELVSGREVLYAGGKKEGEACHSIEVPVMCDFNFTLADGSRVWMNASSSVSYPAEFAADSRTIYARGEIYLEVAKDADRPFYVVADHVKVKVLGTSFNVRSYREEGVSRVTLAEGKVEVQAKGGAYVLKPGEQLAYQDESGQASIRQVDVEDVLSWKRGYYVFRNCRLQEMAFTLQCWYNVQLVMSGKIGSETFYTGVVNKEEPLETFLHRLEEVSDVKCSLHEKQVFIY